MVTAIVILLAFLVLSFPIYISLLSASLYLQLFVNHIPPSIIVSGMYDGVAKSSLLAVPFFILAGSLMEHSSISRRLVGAVLPWLGWFRGGVALAGVVTNEIFGAMSGSAPAAVATIGRILFPVIKDANGEKFALGLLSSGGALSIIMPPSIAMILFAAATETSIGDLFLAGIVPAIIIGCILGVYVVLKSGANSQRIEAREALKQTISAIPTLCLPLIILGGIYSGVFTPTESGAVAVTYTFVLTIIYKDFNLEKLKACILDAIQINARIFILISCSVVFSHALTMAQAPQALVSALQGVDQTVFLLALNILLLIVGCFLDTSAAILLLAPLVAPVAYQIGISPIHLGIVFTVNLAIGMFTPPFGLNLFVMQGVLDKRLEDVSNSVLPFIVLYLIALIIITYFPQIYLWLPALNK